MLVSFDFLSRRSYLSLALTGFFYNLGVWVDKFAFWANPLVSDPVIGPLRASIIYDIPIFLAYLSIVPGMAVFLVRVETDFAESYDAFYHAVRSGDSLVNIQRLKGTLSSAARQGMGDIFKVQGVTLLLLFLVGPRILDVMGISPLYRQLFFVDLAGVGTQVLMLAVFNVLFYLDQRGAVLVAEHPVRGVQPDADPDDPVAGPGVLRLWLRPGHRHHQRLRPEHHLPPPRRPRVRHIHAAGMTCQPAAPTWQTSPRGASPSTFCIVTVALRGCQLAWPRTIPVRRRRRRGRGPGSRRRPGGRQPGQAEAKSEEAELAASARRPKGPGRGFPCRALGVVLRAGASRWPGWPSTFRIINIDADPGVARLDPGEIAELKAGGRNRVISYMNVGSCEAFREYFTKVAARASCPASRTCAPSAGATPATPTRSGWTRRTPTTAS